MDLSSMVLCITGIAGVTTIATNIQKIAWDQDQYIILNGNYSCAKRILLLFLPLVLCTDFFILLFDKLSSIVV